MSFFPGGRLLFRRRFEKRCRHRPLEKPPCLFRGGSTGTRRTSGLPFVARITSSPARARSTRCDRCVLASRLLTTISRFSGLVIPTGSITPEGTLAKRSHRNREGPLVRMKKQRNRESWTGEKDLRTRAGRASGGRLRGSRSPRGTHSGRDTRGSPSAEGA